jgi:hypothetical protein
LLAALGLGGCAAPLQYGGDIRVDHAGFAGRLEALCQLTDGAAQPCAEE